MAEWPDFNEEGDLPIGVYQTSLAEAIVHFGAGTSQRRLVAQRLARIYDLAANTGSLVRFIVYGSFVTNKPNPNDVDVFLLMEDGFDPAELLGEAVVVFYHMAAQTYEGASVFWTTRAGALSGEQVMVEGWQNKREKGRRGILEGD